MKIAKIKYKKVDTKYLMLHLELASGEYKSKKYRFIQDVSNRAFLLEYKGKKFLIKTFDLVKGLLEAIEKQNKK